VVSFNPDHNLDIPVNLTELIADQGMQARHPHHSLSKPGLMGFPSRVRQARCR
jgi:hypothetical protein